MTFDEVDAMPNIGETGETLTDLLKVYDNRWPKDLRIVVRVRPGKPELLAIVVEDLQRMVSTGIELTYQQRRDLAAVLLKDLPPQD